MRWVKLNTDLDGLSGCELLRWFITGLKKKQNNFLLNLYPITEALNEN